MIKIPPDLLSGYTSFLTQKGEGAGQQRYYVKWLRYYLDFCHKYNFEQTKKESLFAFVKKLVTAHPFSRFWPGILPAKAS